jgi:hypothetical protein
VRGVAGDQKTIKVFHQLLEAWETGFCGGDGGFVVVDAGRSRVGGTGVKETVYLCEGSALQEEGPRRKGGVTFSFSGSAPYTIGFNCSVISLVELGLMTRISSVFVFVLGGIVTRVLCLDQEAEILQQMWG